MRARLIFDDLTAFQEISAEVEVTAAVEHGVGAVKIGNPARLPDGRVAVVHTFADVDLDWIVAYITDERMRVEIERF